jgi:hypothetical protein
MVAFSFQPHYVFSRGLVRRIGTISLLDPDLPEAIRGLTTAGASHVPGSLMVSAVYDICVWPIGGS